MNWAILALAALVLSACGGGSPAPIRSSTAVEYRTAVVPTYRPPTPAETMRRYLQFVPPGGYALAKEDYPEIHALVQQKDFTKLYAALGNPRWMTSGIIGEGEVVLFYIKSTLEGPEGDDVVSEILLYYAMKAGDVGKAREIITNRRFPLNRAASASAYGRPPLHLVFDERLNMPRQRELVEMTLRVGADPNIASDRGETVLTAVAGSQKDIPNRKEILQALLKAGADPNAASPGGRSPLRAVINSGIENKKEILALLIASGADPDRPDPSGRLLIHEVVTFAAGTGQAVFEDTVIGWLDLILTPKTKLNGRNREGKTPLGIAYLGQRNRLSAYLQSRGATDYGFRNPSYDLSQANGVTVHGLRSAEIFALNREQCHFILREYDVKFDALSDIPGVEIPIALRSAIAGVAYRHVTGNEKFSIMDCRLAVVLVGWSPILKKNNVKEVIHMRVYAPGAKVGGFGRVSGHNFALALDVAQVVFEDRPELTIKSDWKDHRRLDPCADPLPVQTQREQLLRRMTCETGNFDLFSVILSPHYNKDHFDHLHMELDVMQQGFMR